MTSQLQRSGIMSSGRRNLRHASRDRARAELQDKYREQLMAGGLVRRLLVAWRIRREVRKILEDRAPPDALYLRR
jgi:hypothetical protein